MRFLAFDVTANKATQSVVDERGLNPRPMAWSPVGTAATEFYKDESSSGNDGGL